MCGRVGGWWWREGGLTGWLVKFIVVFGRYVGTGTDCMKQSKKKLYIMAIMDKHFLILTYKHLHAVKILM